MSAPNRASHLVQTAMSVGVGAMSMWLMWLSIHQVRAMLNKSREKSLEAAAVRARFLQLSGRQSMPKLDAYETIIMNDVAFPDEIAQSFGDVGGLHAMKRALYETVILPLQQPDLFRSLHAKSSLLAIPSGILFYGPPGTGKTLLAKSIAKTVNCTFINVRPSTMQNKWFGESQKLVKALFSVAHKLAPSISQNKDNATSGAIFIDEADAFMRKRGSGSGGTDHEASSSMRSEFLALCDGLLTNSELGKSVTILACTNRPFDMDEAFLRRLPRTFLFDLPSRSERVAIFEVLLSGHEVALDVTLDALAGMTDKYSGSDLKEVCKAAAMMPLRRLIKQHAKEDFERVMRGGRVNKRNATEESEGELETAAAAAAAAAADATSAVATVPSGPDAGVVSACSSVPTGLAASTPGPMQLSDFRAAIRAVRPAGYDTMPRLRQFEQQHRAGQPASAIDDDEDDTDDDESDPDRRRPSNGSAPDEDDDEIFQ